MQQMAGSTFFVAFVFAVAVGRVAKGCDPNHCCCPNGQVSAVQVGTGVTFTYNVASAWIHLLANSSDLCLPSKRQRLQRGQLRLQLRSNEGRRRRDRDR